MKRIKHSESNMERTLNSSGRRFIRLLLVLFFSMALSGNSCLYSVSGANEIPLPDLADSSPGESLLNVTDSSPGESLPNVADSSPGESLPDLTDSSFDETDPDLTDSSFDETDPNMADSSPVGSGAEATDSSVTDSVSEESLSLSEITANEPIPVATATVKLCTYAFYTGKAVCPKPVVSFQDTSLIENTDYQVKYSNNIKVGTATVTISGIGRYTGTVACQFRIVNVKLATKSTKYPYTGWARKPAAVITGTPYALQKGVDYTLSYKNNKKCGTATISLTGCGKWYGALSSNFTLYLKKLTLRSVTSPMNLRMVALWTPDKCVTGYQLRYEISGKQKTITMPGGSRQGKTLYQLPKDKTCKVNVRSYLKQDGKTIYSSWSNTKSVKIRYLDWYVTQYESVTGNQAMIYAITDRYNRLILIDGGYTEDADQVRQIIRSHGNRVYAWILTHPHPDHIEAFNKIITTDRDIVVDQIYATKVNSRRYHEAARWYDEIEVYDTFCKIAPTLNNITYLKENDTFSCLGLTFKVLHGWDSNVDALNVNLCNDGSLMFKVSGKVNSMLFCADVQKEMQKFIYPGHKKELAADYVQCGHHGNNGLSNYFYSLVNAKVAFMDAPPRLFITTGKYDANNLRDYLQSRGTKVYKYDGKTHRVRLT